MNKRENKEIVLGFLGGFFTFAAGFGVLARSAYERSHLVTSIHYIEGKKVPRAFDGYRIAVVADLHNNRFGEKNADLIQAIQTAKPDLVLIAGDAMVVKTGRKMDYSALEELLKGLNDKYPIYYVKGNHEERMKRRKDLYPGWYEAFVKLLARYHCIYLENASAVITRGTESLRLTGFDLPETYYRVRFRKGRLPENLISSCVGPQDDACYDILVAHSPLYAEDYSKWGADLAISGHFHGGTIRIPGLGGLMSPQYQFFVGLDRGMYKVNDMVQVTSGGLGTHSIDLRLNNMSELVVISLKNHT